MSIDPSINDLLDAAGKSYSWKGAQVNDRHKLTITKARSVQQTDYKTKEPIFYKDGNPAMQIAVTGTTDERDPEDPGDDGVRTEYFKTQKLAALREGLKKAGAQTLGIGGVLDVKLIERKPTDADDQNIFAVRYTKPPESAFSDDEEPF